MFFTIFCDKIDYFLYAGYLFARLTDSDRQAESE